MIQGRILREQNRTDAQPMTLVIIFGPPAVGKMTVGLELEKLTGLRLFHNHMTADPVTRLFPVGSPSFLRLVREVRRRIFEAFVRTGEPGLIFTFVWDLDDPEDRAFVDATTTLFRQAGGEVCFVELLADQEERLRRCGTPLRLAEKPLLRDVEGVRDFVVRADTEHRMNSRDDFPYPDRHLHIDNTQVDAAAAARQIAEHFGL
jgi:hypothetical protein